MFPVSVIPRQYGKSRMSIYAMGYNETSKPQLDDMYSGEESLPGCDPMYKEEKGIFLKDTMYHDDSPIKVYEAQTPTMNMLRDWINAVFDPMAPKVQTYINEMSTMRDVIENSLQSINSLKEVCNHECYGYCD